jgi:hypothetical protein
MTPSVKDIFKDSFKNSTGEYSAVTQHKLMNEVVE